MFYRKVNVVTIKKLKLKINLGKNPWKYIKILSNIFLINTLTKQALIVNYKKVTNYDYLDLSKDLNDRYTEIKYNDNIFYHYFKNFDKEETLQFEWILIKNSFVISFTTTISSKKSQDEIEIEYEVVNSIMKQITNI